MNDTDNENTFVLILSFIAYIGKEIVAPASRKRSVFESSAVEEDNNQ